MAQIHSQIEAKIPSLRRYARVLTRDRDRADDLVQDCLVRALGNLHTWQPGTNLRAWLFTILRNGHISQVRRHRRSPMVDFTDELPGPAVSGGHEVHVQLRELWRAFDSLSAEHKDVLQLVVVEGLKYEDVADVLGVPLGTVRSRLSRGRRVLRSRLDGECSPGDGKAQAGIAPTGRTRAPTRARPRDRRSDARVPVQVA